MEFEEWYATQNHIPEAKPQARRAWDAAMRMEVLKTKDWHEDYGNCLFFHFDDKASPPVAICGTPLEDVFDKDFWTHFVKNFNFNELFDKAI